MAKKRHRLENPHYSEMEQKLNEVGKGMCLAKWTQVTLQLQTGHNHSCHHPRTHKINLKEIERNPSALHNTQYKKLRRKEMLTGKRPVECDYCWNVEDNSDRFSDRTFKSNESWSRPHFDEIVNQDWREDFNPRYVEVAFSNACNFKCSYCAPAFSTTWMEEIKNYGAYPTTDEFNSLKYNRLEDKLPIPQRESNPYADAFWKWWPDLYHDLHTFRITGGEPLLANDTWKVLDYVLEQKEPNKKLNLSINSNLGVPDSLIDKFIEKLKRIEDEDRVNELIIFTSVDTWGEQAEYIRHGLEFNRFWYNLEKILSSLDRVVVTIMSTYNALSVPNYTKLIDSVYDIKRKYGSNDRYWNSAVFLDSSYLRYPRHQAVQVLPNEFAKNIYRQTQLTEFMATPNFETRLIGYSDIEVQKLRRIYDWHLSRNFDDPKIIEDRKNFYRFFSEHDKRRGTDFCKTYPELEKFYRDCKELC